MDDLIQRLRDAAIYGSIPCPICDEAADRIAALEAEKAERERQEPVAYRYKFPATWGGFVWKESPDRYNGSPPLESQPLYAHPLAMREPTKDECTVIAEQYFAEFQHDPHMTVGRAMFNAVRSVLGGGK